ncbi:MAG: hypothetical protein HFJ04_14175 [Lachnospiraceae bacterium]|nr:hypothetical protein [Lachnospiraceae bacterium]
MDIAETEKIFEGCNWSNRQSIKEALEKYVNEAGRLLWDSEKLHKKTKKMVEDLSEAILEDIEVYDYSIDLWNENVECDSRKGTYRSDENRKIQTFIDRIYEEEGKNVQPGIANYTTRYSKQNFNNLEKGIKTDKNYLENNVGEKLYKKIYPVFWVEMLNRNRGYRKKTARDEECLLKPICERAELEQYIFALLLDTRTKSIARSTIFSGVQRAYTAQNKREKKLVERYNMQDAKDRLSFVRWRKKCLLEEKQPGNREKPVFRNNIATIREMLGIGGEDNIDIPAFIFFLDMLTGWIEFYNFVSLGDSVRDGIYIADIDEEEKKLFQEVQIEYEAKLDELLDTILKCTEKGKLLEYIDEVLELRNLMEELVLDNEDWGVDYAEFEDLIEYNHIAFLYVMGRHVRKNASLQERYYSILKREFINSIADVYEVIIRNKQYEQSNNVEENSVWYRCLFEELFANDISRINKATRIDALNFYDVYITYMK